MEERARLIQQLGGAREAMRAVLADVDVQMEIYPGWTIKHVLAHITGWDDATITSLRVHAGGDDPGATAAQGIDLYNAQSVSTREALSYDQVVREWEFARDELKSVIEEMPQDRFEKALLFPWGEHGTVAQIVAIFVGHELEHAAEIRELIAQSGEA